MITTRIRVALPADAPAIAALNVRAWRWAYAGLVPEALLDGLSIERDEVRCRAYLANLPARMRTWVAERAGRVVGYVNAGPSRDADAALGTGEVYALYVDPAEVRTGVGRALFAHAMDALLAQGCRAVTLWVLVGNERACRFYDAAGGVRDGATQVAHYDGTPLDELRYRFALGD
jgi:ribosomal protein S18 acetylase RimI-like enzyme